MLIDKALKLDIVVIKPAGLFLSSQGPPVVLQDVKRKRLGIGQGEMDDMSYNIIQSN